ncbi:MAG: flagellar basal body rod protein FlgB [Myxococcales bacterium]|nr:flagellar basal body rod protein FlgB [Myxococcales bacterium]
MDLLHGSSARALEDAIHFRLARSAVLAGNLANVDTPGYRRRDLKFVETFDKAVMNLDRTDSKHFGDLSSDPGSRHRLEIGPKGSRPDGNGVKLDDEVIAIHRNTAAFTSRASILARLASLTRIAVTGG